MVVTLAGLATLLIVPLAVGVRLKYEFGRVDELERARLEITDAIEAARQSDTFMMHRYVVPGDTRGRYVASNEYRALLATWKATLAEPEALTPLDAKGQADWQAGTRGVSVWIEEYLARYAGDGDPGGPSEFERQEMRYRLALASLADARTEADHQLDVLRKDLEWLNTAQTDVVIPMAVICFGLAILAWINVRALQYTWVREREISGHLEMAVQESNHRIKNNLQVIGALIDMRMQEPGRVVPRAILDDIVHQIRAVAAVHDYFSHELRSNSVMSDQLLGRLVELTALPVGLKVEVETEPIVLGVKQATAVALITNELLVNSRKHGAGTARVSLKANALVARLVVSDDGPGFPKNFDLARGANLGLALVDTLARYDLNGAIEITNDGGARVEITFPVATAE
jgi:two-component sensor histidine kinase